MKKIGICGAHGTGKTTLAKEINLAINVPILVRTIRNYWDTIGVIDFEKLPKDIRTLCQNYLIKNSIDCEDSQTEFVADRAVVDYLAHTILDTTMPENQLEIYKLLVRERLKNYTHIIYCPIEFEVENELLRADITKRGAINILIKEYLDLWVPGKYLEVRGSVEQRMKLIVDYLA